jgi:acylphosphatase
MVRVTAWLTGRVQGVGMRWWVRSRALELGLAGHAANLTDGTGRARHAAYRPVSRSGKGP